jgi:hypothetical protein
VKRTAFVLAGLALLLSAVGAASGPKPTAVRPPVVKDPAAQTVPDPIHVDQGGDTIANATPITSLPYSDSGTTAGYTDNYQQSCGFACSAQDVVYSYSPSPGGVTSIDIHLCGSSFDTALHVRADTQGNEIACNDDSCGLQSELFAVPVSSGHTYYIIVDGYCSGAYGPYTLNVTPAVTCDMICPPGSVLEGEPTCGDDYLDSFNGGCNSVPPIFQPLPLQDGLVVCGQYGGFLYAGLSYRDTDWYQITLPVAQAVSWTVQGQSDTLCGIINGNSGCPVSSFYAYDYGARCIDHTASAALGPGTWWLWVGTLNFGRLAGPCGQGYLGTLHCANCGTVGVEPATWGRLKSMFK